MGSSTHSWGMGSQGGQKVPKVRFDLSFWEVILETFGHLLGCIVLMFLLKASLSLTGRPLGAQGAQKAPKMEPKGCLKAPCGKCQSHSIYCTGGIVLGSILADFRRFLVPFGAPWASILAGKRRPFFRVCFLGALGVLFGRAGSRGGGPGDFILAE